MNTLQRLIGITTWVAVAVSTLVGMGLPVIFWAITSRASATSLETEVEISASLVTGMVNENPEMWRYQRHHLDALLQRRPSVLHGGARIRVKDSKGTVVTDTGVAPIPPRFSMTRSYPIFDGGREVARMEIIRSLDTLVFRTGLLALLGAGLGIGLFLFLRAFPLRILRSTLLSLDQERSWYHALFDGSNDIVFVHHMEILEAGRIVEANLQAIARLGYPLQELTAMTPDRITEGGWGPAGGNVAAELRRFGRVVFEAVLVARDGLKIPVEVSARTLQRDGRLMLLSVCRDIAARKAAEEAAQRSLREKETLLKEIHHRVKNNLQVISGLLDLEGHFIREPKDREVFRESQSRIRTMALVHERLYRSVDLEEVDLRPFLSELTGQISQSFSLHHQGVGISLDADEVRMSSDTVIPIGLIVNELLSNAFKHGFPGNLTGWVKVRFRALPGGLFELSVEDDGVGFPPGFDPALSTSLGLRLVTLLAQQMKSDFSFKKGRGGRGAVFNMRFREYREAGTHFA